MFFDLSSYFASESYQRYQHKDRHKELDTFYLSSLGLRCRCPSLHPVLKREDRLGKEPFAGFGTVVEDITGSGYTKNQPILLGAF